MFTEATNVTPMNRGRNNSNGSTNSEPVDIWVNTVLFMGKGTEPVRIGAGRPISSFTTTKPVNTSNEELNHDNSISNAFIQMKILDVAADMERGDRHNILPKGASEETFQGIALQIYRVENDSEAEAAAKADAESKAAELLKDLF